MLAGDVAAIAGDSNLDGAFDSSDFVQVFTAGKFETGESATFAEGDWNGDGFFNSSDMVKAFQDGHYNKRLLAADAPDGDAGEDGDGQVDADGQVDGDVMDGDAMDDDGGHHHHHHHGENGRGTPEERIQRAIENIQERIDGGLPDGVDTEAVQAAVNAAAEALGNGDLDAAKEALKGLRDQFGKRNDADRPSPEERIQRVIDKIQERIDGGLPEGVDVDAVQAAVNTAAEALGNGDLDAAKEALHGLRGQLGGRGEHERPSAEERIQRFIDRLQTAVTEGTLPQGIDAATVQAAIDAATAALANSDIDAAKEALAALRGEFGGGRDGGPHGGPHGGRGHGRPGGDHGNDQGGDTDADRIERVTAIIQGMIDRLQTAINEDRLPEGIDAATVQAAIDAAAAALEAGDIDAARDALSGLRGGRGDHGNGGGEGGDDGDDTDGDNNGRGNGRGPRG